MNKDAIQNFLIITALTAVAFVVVTLIAVEYRLKITDVFLDLFLMIAVPVYGIVVGIFMPDDLYKKCKELEWRNKQIKDNYRDLQILAGLFASLFTIAFISIVTRSQQSGFSGVSHIILSFGSLIMIGLMAFVVPYLIVGSFEKMCKSRMNEYHKQ